MENKEVRLIDANALIESITSAEKNDGMGMIIANTFKRCVLRQPTIDPESLRPHGKWFECDYVEYDGHSECIHYPKAALGCTNCRNVFKKELLWKRNYCPNCGAVMQGVKDE